MKTLARYDVRDLCHMINTYGDGTGPLADDKSFWWFSVAHARACLLRAMAESAAAAVVEGVNVVTEDDAGTLTTIATLSWDRANELNAYLHANRDVRYLHELREVNVPALEISVTLELDVTSRRVIAASNAQHEDPDVLASDCDPATLEECVTWMEELADQRLEFLAEDFDDLPFGEVD